MSQAAPDDENVRRVRERVVRLAREIEQMSGDDIPPNVFFQEFLNRVVQAIGARGGAVWLIEEGRLGLAAQVNLEQVGLQTRPGAMQVNEQLLTEVLQTGEARTLTHGGETQLPTEHVLVLSALHKEKQCVGVVELFQRPDVPEKAQSGYMQFLEQMCGYASRYIEGKRRGGNESADLKNKFWTDFEQFVLRIQRTLQEQEVADAAASDARPLLGADRVSVVSRKGRSVRVVAVSGQSSVNARANLIVALRKLSRRVIESGETLTYTGRIEGLPPQIEKPLAEFVQESGSRMVMIVPLFESGELVREQGEEAERKRRSKRPKVTGCLVIEQVAESQPAPQLEQRAELLADHIGAAMWNGRQHHRIFGLSLWKLIGKALEWFRGRKLAITTAVLAVLAAIVAAGTLIRVPYPVNAEGKWMPQQQHAVFARMDGEITGLLIDTKDDDAEGVRGIVSEGELLVQMKNDDLQEQLREVRAEIEKNGRLLENARANVADAESRARDPQLGAQAQSEVSRLRLERDRYQEEILIATEKSNWLQRRIQEKLSINSPADGVIPNFQLKQLLADRPVRQGDHLFDVMNVDGPWHMELLVEEKRMGHILRAVQSRADQNHPINLEAEFMLATQPDQKFKARLTKIASRSTTDPELGTVFELTAEAVPGQTLPEKRIGAEVTVRLYCNDCSLAYWAFGDIVEFVQKNVGFLW